MRHNAQTIHLRGRESLLIILMGALGDLVRGFCLPGLIKSRHPDIRISWLVEPRWRALVDRHDQIDTTLVFDRPRGLKALPALEKDLRRRSFDITLDLQRHFKSGLFSLLSGSPHRLGFHPRNAKEFNWVFNNRHIPYFDETNSKLRHYLKFAEAMGLAPGAKLDFGLDHLAETPIAAKLLPRLPRPYIVMVMGSSWATKNWYEDGYHQLLTRVLEDMPVGIALVGDNAQRQAAGRICSGFNTRRLVDLTGKTDLVELTALLGQAAAGIGPDSGPGHLAAAVGTPYVTLLGPTPPGRVVPHGCRDLAVVATTDCAGCYRKKCPLPECHCMRTITPEMAALRLEVALGRHADDNAP